MVGKQIYALYFSPTGTTRKLVTGIAEELAGRLPGKPEVESIDFTLPEARKGAVAFTKEDIVVVGVPVYAGRVPNVLLKYMKAIAGNGALAVAVVLFGNRDYDDALVELQDVLEGGDFKVVGGGAFIGEHSFSRTLAANRPDEQDMALAADFARRLHEKIASAGEIPPVVLKGNRPYRDYYRIKDESGNPVDIRKVQPKTNADCIECGTCARVCPMGSIDSENLSEVTGICIKCCACIKMCPVGAKYFDHGHFVRHMRELEIEFTERREPEVFV